MKIYWLEQTTAALPTGNQWLSPPEAARLGGLRIPKRRADWRLGRWTAKHAVAAHLNLSIGLAALANIEIRAASSGAPEVFLGGDPANVAISLSHSAGTALCTVSSSGITLGCDLETIEPRSDAFVADYFTPEEQALVAQTSAQDQPLLLTLLWSAKESALKALRVGLRLDTRCMQIIPDLSANPDTWRALTIRYEGITEFAGWWRSQNHLVRTVVSEIRGEVPTGLRRDASNVSTQALCSLSGSNVPAPVADCFPEPWW